MSTRASGAAVVDATALCGNQEDALWRGSGAACLDGVRPPGQRSRSRAPNVRRLHSWGACGRLGDYESSPAELTTNAPVGRT